MPGLFQRLHPPALRLPLRQAVQRTAKTSPTSPLNLIHSTSAKSPSVTKRIALAHALARCLMYLHSVNWLHKGLRSNKHRQLHPVGRITPVLGSLDRRVPNTHAPTSRTRRRSRRPSTGTTTSTGTQRSSPAPGPAPKKPHDIYALGIVLGGNRRPGSRLTKVMEMPRDDRAARSEGGEGPGPVLAERRVLLERRRGPRWARCTGTRSGRA